MTMPPNNFNRNSARANLHTPDHPRHRRMLEELISLYQDNEASPAEQITVRHYLDTCAECRRLHEEYLQVGTAMQNFLDNITPPRPIKLPAELLQKQPGPKTVDVPAPERNQPRRAPVLGGWLSPVGAGRLGGAVAAMLVIVSLLGLVLIYRGGNSEPDSGTPAVANTTDQTATEPPTFTPTTVPPTTVASTTPAATTAVAPSTEAAVAPAPRQTTPPPTAAPAQTSQANAGGSGQAPVAAPTATSKPAPTVTAAPAKTSAIAETTSAGSTTSPSAAALNSTPAVSIDTPIAITPTATTSPEASATSGATTVPPVTTAVATTAIATTAAATTAAPVANTPVVIVTQPAAVATSSTTQTLPPAPNTLNGTVPGWIGYVSGQDSEIHLITSDGSTDVTLSKNSAAQGIKWQELVWSHDGKWVAAVAMNTGTGSDAIYLFDINQRNEAKLNFVAEGFAPSWSPDDLAMAYLAGPTRTKSGLKAGRPSVVTLKKRFVQPPATLSPEYQTLAPQWFDDGNRVLVGQNYIVAPDGTPLQSLDLPFENTCTAASLSPVGNKLAILDQQGISVFDLNKSLFDKNKPVTRVPVNPPGKVGIRCGGVRLQWTPSGRSVSFYVNDGRDITCAVSVVGAGASCLAGVQEPSFTVDGSHLVAANGDGQFYAFAFGSKPTNPRVLGTTKVRPVWQPRWS